jgi:hypothetical protein
MKIDPLIGSIIQEVIPGETRVFLVGTRYKPEASEPVWGSAYECPGTVMEMCDVKSDYDVQVEWDNDHTNAYQIEDLRALRPRRSNNPNYHFKVWKRKNGR